MIFMTFVKSRHECSSILPVTRGSVIAVLASTPATLPKVRILVAWNDADLVPFADIGAVVETKAPPLMLRGQVPERTIER